MADSYQNHFLIAMPTLLDTFFYRSVVYLFEHDEGGALGLIVNRPTQIMLDELLKHLRLHNDSNLIHDTPILFGGPVQKSQGMVLHDQANAPWTSNIQLNENLYLTTSSDILEAIGTKEGPDHALITLGHASWSPGQLEEELAENSWLTVPAENKLFFDTPADDRWEKAAKLIGIDIHLMSNTTGHA